MLFLALAAVVAAAQPAPFGRPASDAELAGAVSQLAPPEAAADDLRLYGLRHSVPGEIVDQWWAEDGAALIMEAVKPRPGMPVGFDPTRLNLSSLQFRSTVTAVTR